MEASTEQLEELARQTRSLRAALSRVRAELEAASALEQELSEKLRELGVAREDDAEPKTTVDKIEAAGLPGHRSSSSHPSSQTLKAAAVGAGLTIGLALVVLLIVDVALARRTAEIAPPAPQAAATLVPPPSTTETRDEIPPPPPPAAGSAESTPVAAAPVTIASAPIPRPPAPIPAPPTAKAEPSAPTAAAAGSGSSSKQDRGF
jgi:hypothetical protein